MADHATCLPLAQESVRKAHEIIKPHIHRTPVLTCTTLDRIASTASRTGHPAPRFRLFFKCENYQKIGAFKARGAYHAVKHLIQEMGIEEVRRRGVITHSSGNHAQALALAASTFDIPAYVVMPTISTPSKIAGTQHYTEHVIFSGSTSTEREAKVEEVRRETGAILVPPYDHPDIILGQGTTGLELDEQYRSISREEGRDVKCSGQVEKQEREQNWEANNTIPVHNGDLNADLGAPILSWNLEQKRDAKSGRDHGTKQLDAVIAPIGGGGLLGGIATYFSKPSNSGSKTLVFGAEPSYQGGDDVMRGLVQGKRIEKVSTLTIADGLRTPAGVVNWSIVSDRAMVEGVYAVTEDQIKGAMRLLLERMKVFVEPSGAVSLAVVLYNEEFREMMRKKQEEQGRKSWDVGVVLSGGNTTVDAIAVLFGRDRDKGEDEPQERAEAKVGINGEKLAENVAG